MFDRSQRGRPGFGSAGSSSYFDYQEDRLVRVTRHEHNAHDALKEPASDSFVVQIADAETSKALQREYFSAGVLAGKSIK